MLSTKQRMANILLVWAAMSGIFRKSGVLSRKFPESFPRKGWHRRVGYRPMSSTVLTFVHNSKHKPCSNSHCPSARTKARIHPHHYRNCQRTPLTIIKAGRERRVSSSPSPNLDQNKLQNDQQQQQFTQSRQKLAEKEEAERQKRLDQLDQRIQKLARVEERIGILEEKLANDDSAGTITDAEKAELEGLQRNRDNFEEQYDPTEFSEEHIAYKAMHNEVFAQLVRWCETNQTKDAEPPNVFFLDGPDGGTASSLIERGKFAPSQCYVANRHESTCVALRESGGGLLPEENVVHATCSEALTKGAEKGAFGDVDFSGFYFDGCGGYAPHIVNMMTSALLVLENDDRDETSNERENSSSNDKSSKYKVKPRHPIVVGYSLLGGTKNLVEKELEVSRALTIIARSRGMRMVHALEDPSRFGLSNDVAKLGGKRGTTFTTWLVLEPDPYLI